MLYNAEQTEDFLPHRIPRVLHPSKEIIERNESSTQPHHTRKQFSSHNGQKALASLVFDESFYLEKNSSIRTFIENGDFRSGEDHWNRVGQRKKLIHRFVDPQLLDEKKYFAIYPEAESDVQQARFDSAAEHWVQHGRFSGFHYFPVSKDSTSSPHRFKKRIVFLAATDFANTMTGWVQAIRHHSRRIEAFIICLRPHPFDYEFTHDVDLCDIRTGPGSQKSWLDHVIPERVMAARELLETADLLVQSDELHSHGVLELFAEITKLDLMVMKKDRIVIRHPGSNYRADSASRNQRDLTCRGQIVHLDLLRLACPNSLPGFAVVDHIPSEQEIYQRFSQSRILIVHTPSRKSTKGSNEVRRVVERVIESLPEQNIEYQEVHGVPNRVIQKRKGESHIHIDQFNPYGSEGIGAIGTSSCEGWENGNLVLSSVNNIIPRAWNTWGIDSSELPLIDIGTDENVFFERLHDLCKKDSSELATLAIQQSRIAYRAFGPRRTSAFFESIVEEKQDLPRSPAVHRSNRKPVFVCGQWSAPAAMHKQRYYSLLAEAFDARVLQVDSEERLAERVMELRPSIVITANFPLYRVYSDRWLHELPTSMPLVTWHDDLRRQMNRNLEEVLHRSDAVISVLREAVLTSEQFPFLKQKLWRLPWFIPRQIPPYQLNYRPEMKCLVPGTIEKRRHLRQRALQEISKEKFEHLPHPGYGCLDYSNAVVGQKFYDHLHRFACVLTDGGIYRYTVAKYFEIPYSGALMLADPIPDLDELGFRAGQHFLSVTETTPLGPLVEDILANFQHYQDIREEGRRLIMERHTEEIRRIEAREMASQIMKQLNLPIPKS